MEFVKRYQLIFLFGVLSVSLFSIALFTDGTCDSGDSVTHYLYARYAFIHPVNFIDHWAKPVFVLIASLFAQFGFMGVKLMNVIVALCTAFFVFRIAVKLEFKSPLLAPVFLFAFPLYTISIFSGLTEPLFGLMITISFWLILNKKLTAGLILVSFLPFCRSEGLIIVIIVGLYLFLKRKNTSSHIGRDKIYLLFVGHVFYSIVGGFHYKDIFWVFSNIPYKGEERYGHGDWFRFFEQSPAIFGVPLLFVLIVGLVSFYAEKNKAITKNLFPEMIILITASFLAIFLAHVIFWRFGLFSSFGLKRVMVAVLPLAALICLSGINTIQEWISQKNKLAANIAFGSILCYVLSFPFTSNPYAIDRHKDFSLRNDQQAIIQVVQWIKAFHPNEKIYSDHYYVAMAGDIDPFDPTKFQNIKAFKEGNGNGLVVWDDWYAGDREMKDAELEKNCIELMRVEEGNARVVVFGIQK